MLTRRSLLSFVPSLSLPSMLLSADNDRKGLAWVATKGDLRFFLIATLHALTLDDYPLPKVIDSSTAMVQGVFVEFTPYEQSLPSSKRLIQQRGFLPNGSSLLNILPSSTAVDLAKFIKLHPTLRHLTSCKPWLASIWIQDAMGRECGMLSQHGVESYLCRKCASTKKTVRLLESQVEALDVFEKLATETQIEVLDSTLKLGLSGSYENLSSELRTAWSNGDEAKLAKVFESSTANTEAFRRAVIAGRNQVWLTRLLSLKLAGSWMIAAGAQHFLGDSSLVALLRAKNFDVRRST